MAAKLVECLNCGAVRHLSPSPARPGAVHDCPKCGYVGWADTESLTEALRNAFREHALEQRRRIAW